MNFLQAAILGIVQGVTEFLPVSSTAHLRLVPALFRWPDPGAAYTAVLQLGSLVAVIGFFLKELIAMVLVLADAEKRKTPEGQRLFQLILGTIPIGVTGVLFRHSIEGPLRSLTVIATCLIVVGIVLAIVERFAPQKKPFEEIGLRDAIIVGLAQALALLPGVSRSGITLAAAMAIGIRRDAAARFSFLLSVPAVAAAGLFELPKVIEATRTAADSSMLAALFVGLVAAAISGYASIAWLIRFLRTKTTYPFVVYRIALGIGILTLLFLGQV